MMKSESDLMKGIDDKFQKLLSQFEMNMNILEMKSKRQQFLAEKTNDGPESDRDKSLKSIANQPLPTGEKYALPALNCVNHESGKYVESSLKDRRESTSEKSESMVTVKEIDTESNKHKRYSMKIKMNEKVNEEVDDEDDDDDDDNADSMGNVLRYISECAELKNRKNKRRKKSISFGVQNKPAETTLDKEIISNTAGSKKSLKKKKAIEKNETLSGTSSKRKTNHYNSDVVRKCSKTVTNISKKGKKRTLRNSNMNTKDWISFNRNNAGKQQKPSKSKTQQSKKDDVKRKNFPEKTKTFPKKEVTQAYDTPENKIEHFDTIENKLIKDFFQNEVYQAVDFKNKKNNNDVLKKNEKLKNTELRRNNEEKKTLKGKTPLAVNEKLREVNIKVVDLPKKNVIENKRNVLGASNGVRNAAKGGDIQKNDKKGAIPPKNLLNKINLINNKENNNNMPRLETKMTNRSEDRKTVASSIELSKAIKERFHEDMREVPRAKSEMKVGSAPCKMSEDLADLEDVKVELDEYFSEIPFVVGRSISRTFNLGLSFQHAMSMLKRVHSKKEVKEVLNIGRPESVPYSESLHCNGSTCEAMYSCDWTKEDEEAWAENPWDPELNRRRPKCTCLPNNCTTLKNVLKQLSIKNPATFSLRSLQPSLSSTTNKLDIDSELLLKRPVLKRAKSQTRTELLRNIRSIQIQLTPSTEILK